jgi:Domain of unknown function (DUF4440)
LKDQKVEAARKDFEPARPTRRIFTGASKALLLLVLLPVSSRAQAPPELQQAMQQRLEAVWSKNAATWARLTSDEFTLVVPEGTLMTKEQRLAALKTEKPEPNHALRNEQTHMYGDTAVHRFVDGSEWVLEVWHLQKGVWRVVAAQVNFVNP